MDFDLLKLENKISLKNVRYYQVDAAIFASVIDALRRSVKLKISYRSNNKNQESTRTIQPLHLVIYMGNWHLLALCEQKNDIRIFALSRIQKIEVLTKKISHPVDVKKIKDLVYRSYGIFLGGKQIKVVLKFAPQVYGIVKDQVWTFDQKLEENKSGEITLTLAVADFTEIKRDILSFGEHVQVVHPPELKRIIQDSIEKMAKIY